MSKVQDLQKVFNKFIRLRDQQDDYFVCISCHTRKPLEHMQAGHYYPGGTYTSLRFDEVNVNGQCIQCNYYKHGNLIGYREGLIEKYGIKEVEMLDLRASKKLHKWGNTELDYLMKHYKKKIKTI